MENKIDLQVVHFIVTGNVAHSRLAPLLPSDWIDESPSNSTKEKPLSEAPQFVWENAPRCETRNFRDSLRCYSHLPNGTAILDSKWNLALLFRNLPPTSHLATLETHCFRGIDGFCRFVSNVAWDQSRSELFDSSECYDLLEPGSRPSSVTSNSPNMWVIKDASSNGAGGIWVVANQNVQHFCNPETSPLHCDHKYVAQRYVWPLVLYGGRKCHVRVYGAITSDGRAFVHRRAFLHVANDPFTNSLLDDSIHITNCCANSHDPEKFAGEILVDFQGEDQDSVDLHDFYPSIKASISMLSQQALPFLSGGQRNGGFEYMGFDFILSYRNNEHVAYLLEVNAPPSQDTATGLPHAENLHNEVIRDLMSLWVIPKVEGRTEITGGWCCVYEEKDCVDQDRDILPSKATILNKIRWALYERKILKQQEGKLEVKEIYRDTNMTSKVAHFARSFFPFFDYKRHGQIFAENAGGSQVPVQVIREVTSSLSARHRSSLGAQAKSNAKRVLATLLGAQSDEYSVFLGSNATSLLETLALRYVQSGKLRRNDEIVICSENHLANVTPWLEAAKLVGAVIKWWVPTQRDVPLVMDTSTSSRYLGDLITNRTVVVALTHASNVLGEIRDIRALNAMIKLTTRNAAHCVVDGVAAVPHIYTDVQSLGVDWYAVSCHKLFGPHLGALCGRTSIVTSLVDGAADMQSPMVDSDRLFEIGTISYEACAGICGLGRYYVDLSSLGLRSRSLVAQTSNESTNESRDFSTNGVILTTQHVIDSYRLIRDSELELTDFLLNALNSFPKVEVLANQNSDHLVHIPVISFVHRALSSKRIVDFLEENSIICRYGTFLSTKKLQDDFGLSEPDGAVRISLAHYNSINEAKQIVAILEEIPGWS